jgi:hypothetical protein
MATFEFSARRLILAGGFAIAVAAAPAVAVFTVPVTAMAQPSVQNCPGGEEADPFTGVCIPHTVPNSNSVVGSIPGGNLPAVELPGNGGSIPCTGANSGQCIGLAESEQGQASATPRSTIGSSPTVTGSTG